MQPVHARQEAVHAARAVVRPVGVLVGRAQEQDVAARGVRAVASTIVEGLITLPFDLDIFAPW